MRLTSAQRAVIRDEIALIYDMWHCCSIKQHGDVAPKGTLCDGCTSSITAHMKDIEAKIKAES